MRQFLNGILLQEGVSPTDYPEVVMNAIIDKSDGIPRNGIKLLDKVVDIMEDHVAIQIVNDSITSTDDAVTMDLIVALKEGKSWVDVAEILKRLQVEPEEVRRAILGYFGSVLLNSKTGAERYMNIIGSFSENLFYSGKAGLIAICCSLCK